MSVKSRTLLIAVNLVIISLWLQKKYYFSGSISSNAILPLTPTYRTLQCSGQNDDANRKTSEPWKKLTPRKLTEVKEELRGVYSDRRKAVRDYCEKRQRNVSAKLQTLWRGRIW